MIHVVTDILLACLLAAAALPSPAGDAPPADGPCLRVAVSAPWPEALAGQLHGAGFDVLQTDVDGVQLVITPSELQRLSDMGLAADVLEQGAPWNQLHASGDEGDPAGSYPDLATVEAALAAAEAAHPAICRVVDLTTRYGLAPTAEGRHLLALKLSDAPELDEDEPAVLVVAAHHSRELVTPVLALDAIDSLLAGYGSDPALTALIDDFEVWIAPVWNPDGYVHVFEVDNLWRKNRSLLPGGVGVDLNRNYPVGWDSNCGGATSVSSNTYRGPSAASEPETQTMLALAADRHFARVLDYHSYGSQVRFGYGCWTHPQDDWLQALATGVSLDMGYAGNVGSSCCLGGDIHLHSALYGAVALLAETHTSFQPAYSSALSEAEQITPGALAFLGAPLPVTGHVTDACSGAPLVADLSVLELPFTNGESNGSFGPFGRYHAQLAPGVYSLRFSAPGYAPRVVPVTVLDGLTTSLDVALVPSVGCWTTLDGGTVGSAGVPHLMGAGNLMPGWPVQIHLLDAAPNQLALLLLAFESTPASFLGGTLHAFPFVEQKLVGTNSSGRWVGATTWPPGLPPGLQVFFQLAVADPGVPLFGAALSDGLSSLSP